MKLAALFSALCSLPAQLAIALAALSNEPQAVTTAPLPCYCPVWNVAVLDGDTFRVSQIEMPWGVGLRDQTVRVNDYDAWETSRRRQSVVVTDEEIEQGRKAEEAVRVLFGTAQAIYVSPGPQERDNYGRLLARVTVVTREGKTIELARWMKQRGHCRH